MTALIAVVLAALVVTALVVVWKRGWWQQLGNTLTVAGGVVSAVAAATAIFYAQKQTELAREAAISPAKLAMYSDLFQSRTKFIEAFSTFDGKLRGVLLSSRLPLSSDGDQRVDAKEPILSTGDVDTFLSAYYEFKNALNTTALTWPAYDRTRFEEVQNATYRASGCFIYDSFRTKRKQQPLTREEEKFGEASCAGVSKNIDTLGESVNSLLRYMQEQLDGRRAELEGKPQKSLP